MPQPRRCSCWARILCVASDSIKASKASTALARRGLKASSFFDLELVRIEARGPCEALDQGLFEDLLSSCSYLSGTFEASCYVEGEEAPRQGLARLSEGVIAVTYKLGKKLYVKFVNAKRAGSEKVAKSLGAVGRCLELPTSLLLFEGRELSEASSAVARFLSELVAHERHED